MRRGTAAQEWRADRLPYSEMGKGVQHQVGFALEEVDIGIVIGAAARDRPILDVLPDVLVARRQGCPDGGVRGRGRLVVEIDPVDEHEARVGREHGL